MDYKYKLNLNFILSIFLFKLCLLVAGSYSKNVGGYYLGASTRSPNVSDINPHQLTHLFYAFVVVEDNGSLTIQNNNVPRIINAVKSLPNLKKANPDLKILFSVVNQNHSFSIVSASEDLRKTFAQNAITLIKQYDYNGLDLDWELPSASDKENFVLLLKELKEAFQKHNFLLTAAVRAIPVYKGSGYNIPEMVKYLDLINIMTYDYFGSWSEHTGQNSPLYPSSKDSSYEKTYLNIAAAGKLWQEAGAPKEILNIGIPFYGRTFTLKNGSDHGLHAPVKGAGSPASPTYYLIRKNFSKWTEVWDDENKNPYKYSGNEWLGYDDKRSIIEKVKYAVNQDYAGVFIWHLAGDDIYGEFGTKWELLTVINENIKDSNEIPDAL